MRDSRREPDDLYGFEFKAMNTTVSCTLPCTDDRHAERVQREAMSWFRYVEERFSRFLPGSELTQLNERAGTECLVSSAMLEVLQLAETYRQETEGAFNPLVLNALRSAGYSRSFELLAPATDAGDRSAPYPRAVNAPNGGQASAGDLAIAINPRMRAVKLPSGSAIDLGGIVKSWAVDRLAVWFRREYGLRRGLVNAGGDLAVWGGSAPNDHLRPGADAARIILPSRSEDDALTACRFAMDGDAARAVPSLEPGPSEQHASADARWRIGIEDPWTTGREIGLLVRGDGASATSSTLGRRWSTDRGTMHHLIDPATMLPAVSDVVQCTTSGGNAVDCEIWAKTLCILGSEAGLERLARRRLPIEALLFTRERETIFYGDIASFGNRWHGVPATKFIQRHS